MIFKTLSFILFNFIASVSIGVSMIIIPWNMVSIDGTGEALFSASLITTSLLAFISPFAGRVIDFYSRKNFLFILLTFMGVALFASGMAMKSETYEVLVLMTYFGITQVFFMLYYNIRGAFIQECFSVEERNIVNSLMEFETQFATLLSSMITIHYINKNDTALMVTYCSIALFVAAISVLFFSTSKSSVVRNNKLMEMPSASFIMKKYKHLFLFGVASNAPFLIVMATNIINPVYFNHIHLSDISIIATIGIVYTIAAMIGAAVFPKLIQFLSIKKTVLYSLTLSLIASIYASIIGGEVAIIASSFIWGITNAICKITYNNVAMKEVDTNQIGQYYSLIQSSIYTLRTTISILLLWLITSKVQLDLYTITMLISFSALIVMSYINKKDLILSKET
ncbi:MFS transporter [Aeromonas veronii]|uniref:MFS transporter n=1 Tax=Aeromonas veronii TaxID=654 RepID=UPI003BA273B8